MYEKEGIQQYTTSVYPLSFIQSLIINGQDEYKDIP